MQRKLEKEMHLMMDDLELPNTSMTISSLSQSPWQGTKSQQSYLSHPLNEGGESARNENQDSQNKSKELQNFIGSSLSSNDYSDFKNIQVGFKSGPFPQDLKSARSPRETKRTTGSPEFAKELTVTDDLTVSHTDEDASEYRQMGEASEPFGIRRIVRNQNRTFADSVLNHHANQLRSNAQDYKGQTSVKRGAKSRYGDSSANEKTDESAPYGDDLERDDGRPSNALTNNDLDQISDIDQLLAQTQISNKMKIGAQSHFARSNITTADQNQLSRRTNLFKKMEDAESLSYTPDRGPMGEHDFGDSHDGSQNWFGQKSYIASTANKGSIIEKVSDQSTSSANQINPVSKLKARIKEQNSQMKKTGPLTKALRDQELEKALEFQMPVTIAEEDSQIIEETARVNTQFLTAEITRLQEDNLRLAAELERKQVQPQNELLRARALDAARQEIRELQETTEIQRAEIERLQEGRQHQDEFNARQRDGITSQIKSMEMQLEKQKIIIASHKREMESAQQAASDATKTAEATITRSQSEFEQKSKQFTQRIALLEKTIKQYETEYNQKADELDDQLAKIEIKDQEFKELEHRFVDLQNDLKVHKQKCVDLEKSLDQVSQKNRENHELNAEAALTAQQRQIKDFDSELQTLKQLHAKEVAKVKEENSKLRDLLQQARSKCQSLEQDASKDDDLAMLKVKLGMDESLDADSVVQSLLEMTETNKLLEAELTNAAQHLQKLQTEKQDLIDALNHAQKAVREERAKPSDSQFTMQLVFAKDAEITDLKNKLVQSGAEIERMKQDAVKVEDQLWDCQAELKVARTQFQTQATELSDCRTDFSLLTKAISALGVEGLTFEPSRALEYLQSFQKQVIQQQLKETKKAMTLEHELAQQHKFVQETKLEMDFQTKENQRIREIMNKLEADRKAGLKGIPVSSQESQCEPLEVKHVSNQSCQTLVNTDVAESQTSFDFERLVSDNEEMAAKIADLAQQLQQAPLTQSQLKRDVEAFKCQFQAELKSKSDQLDEALAEVESERASLKSTEDAIRAKLTSEISAEFKKKALNMQSDFEGKLKAERAELEQQMAIRAAEFETKEFELNTRLSNQAEQPTVQLSKLTKDLSRAQVAIRDKDREIKRLKDESEKQKQKHAEQLLQVQEAADEAAKERVDEQAGKSKAAKEKAVEKAVEKVRVELRNQMDLLKNEFAKSKSDWQRDRKKLVSDHEEQLVLMQQEHELNRENEVRTTREKTERVWKKKLEERERELTDEMRKDVQVMKEKHKLEVLAMQEAYDLKEASNPGPQKTEVKDELLAKVKSDLCDQLSREFTQELTKTNVRHATEISNLKEEFELKLRQERLANMPLQKDPITPQNMTADSNMMQMQSPAIQQRPLKNSKMACQTETSYSCMCSDIYQRRQEETELYIEQLKQNFETELNRQEAFYEEKQKHQSLVSTKLMERLVLLECDKILQLIQFKQSQSTTSPLTMNDVNKSRNGINDVIKDILTQSQVIKPSFDKIKAKLSEVLASLKSQIDSKYSRQFAELQATREREIQLKSVKTIQVAEMERPKLAAAGLGYQTLNNESVDQSQDGYTPGCECHGNYRCKQCLSSPKFKYPKEATTEQSRDYSYLKGQVDEMIDDEVIIRGSTQDFEDDRNRAQALFNRLAPNRTNAKGAIVVEVEKVVRDLLMLHRTIKSAKFYRLLIGSAVIKSIDVDNDALLNEQDQDKVVNTYRELLNHFFKVIVKLNSAVDDLTQNNEVYKLKLLNLDLKQQITELKAETQGVVTRQKVDDILGFFQKLQHRFDLLQPTKEALEALEFLQFQISKHQFKLNQITDLFCIDGAINRDLETVEAKCHEFAAQGGENFLESTMNMRKSAQQWNADQQNLSAELLSPDETANLIANIMQKMQRPQLNQTQQIVSQNLLPTEVSMITEQPVTPQELLRQALVLCQNQSTNASHLQTQSLSPRTLAYAHQQSTFSTFTNPRPASQMPLQKPPKRASDSIQRSRSLSSHGKQQRFVTLPPNSQDSNSQHSGYLHPQVMQSQSIDYQSQQIGGTANPFSSIESNPGYRQSGTQMRPPTLPNQKKRQDAPGSIASSLSAAKTRFAANKNMPLQQQQKDRYHTETQEYKLPQWLN